MSPLEIRGPKRTWKREDFATASFALFLDEIDRFDVLRNGVLDFEAKQRMLSRAQAIGIVEAYSLDLPQLYVQSTDTYLALLQESQKRVALGGHEKQLDVRAEGGGIVVEETYDPHREEIRTVLVAAVLEHLEARRMQHVSLAVAVLAAALGAIALFK